MAKTPLGSNFHVVWSGWRIFTLLMRTHNQLHLAPRFYQSSSALSSRENVAEFPHHLRHHTSFLEGGMQWGPVRAALVLAPA